MLSWVVGGGHRGLCCRDAVGWWEWDDGLWCSNDLLNGSSSASETYANTCLACTEDFDVKEIELWGFVYASKYEETVSLLRTEAPGISRW
ncbi:TLD-domain containing nucleolar protein [Actinidia rufa]|uniref:Oxidation resistance protein 1 n=1 Tax=Actinidia rufa TaxID=165716 RepID=A0A7J0F0F6_9ERIC|nr:TLD-domain containing nucleolar protein [Actinidia rufa]